MYVYTWFCNVNVRVTIKVYSFSNNLVKEFFWQYLKEKLKIVTSIVNNM